MGNLTISSQIVQIFVGPWNIWDSWFLLLGAESQNCHKYKKKNSNTQSIVQCMPKNLLRRFLIPLTKRYWIQVFECPLHFTYENFANRLCPFLRELGDEKTYFPLVSRAGSKQSGFQSGLETALLVVVSARYCIS